MKKEGKIQVHSENIFPIIKKWLYSDKDIFLRELISNGCDAINKLEKLRTIGEAPKSDAEPELQVLVDKEAGTLTVRDNGLGMTADEVEKYITQVAFSGAEEFIAKYKEKTEGDAGIIGHFGLGFYSAFMVAASVEIQTLSYQTGAEPVRWVSDGSDAYEMEEGSRTTPGTDVILHIAPEEADFLEEGKIREILGRYCAFMPYNIYLNPKKPEDLKDDEKNYPINETHPLWTKPPKDCTAEEYEQFYMSVFHDFNKPLFWIHLNVDYPFRLQGILYFPKLQSKVEVMPGEVKLYSSQVYVADNIKEVIPEFLLLLKGVIDCPDLPLNVSRSFLQNDGDVGKISRHITKKVSDKLHSIFQDSREDYEKYWEDIAPFIKFGCIKDEKFYDRVKDILLFKTVDGKFYTLEDYPKGEGEEKKIYYATDEALQSQYIRLFREQGTEAALLDHVIDPHFISFLEYKEEGKLRFARIDSDLGEEAKDSGEDTSEEKLAELFREVMAFPEEEKVTVKAQALKNVETPAVILLSEYARRMQDMGAAYGMDFGGGKPETTLMLNAKNPLIQSIPALEGEKRELICRQVYDLAVLSHRALTPEEMSRFMDRNVQILSMLSENGSK